MTLPPDLYHCAYGYFFENVLMSQATVESLYRIPLHRIPAITSKRDLDIAMDTVTRIQDTNLDLSAQDVYEACFKVLRFRLEHGV